MTWDTMQQAVRIVLGWFGAYLATKGMLNEEMATTFTGGLLALAQVAWWYFWNNRRPA